MTPALFESCRAAIRDAGVDPKEIKALALSTRGSGFGGLDDDELIRPRARCWARVRWIGTAPPWVVGLCATVPLCPFSAHTAQCTWLPRSRCETPSILIVKNNLDPENYTIEAGSIASANCYRWFRNTLGSLEVAMAKYFGELGNAYHLLNCQIDATNSAV